MFYTYTDINHYNAVNNTNFKSLDEVTEYLDSVSKSYYNLIKALHSGHAELVHHILQHTYTRYLSEYKINDLLQPILELRVSPYTLEVILNDIGDYLDLDAIIYRIVEDYDIDTLVSRSDLVTVFMNYIIDTNYKTDFYMVSSFVSVFAAVDDEDMFRRSIEYFRSRIDKYDLRFMINFLEYIDNGEKYTRILCNYINCSNT